MPVVGAFASQAQVERAVERLLAAGVTPQAISVATPQGAPEPPNVAPEPSAGQERDTTRAAGIGALLGGVAGASAGTVVLPGLGALVAATPLVLGGALVGSIVGLLTHLGLGEAQATYVTERLQAGQFLVIVREGAESSADRPAQVQALLLAAGAQEVRVAPGEAV